MKLTPAWSSRSSSRPGVGRPATLLDAHPIEEVAPHQQRLDDAVDRRGAVAVGELLDRRQTGRVGGGPVGLTGVGRQVQAEQDLDVAPGLGGLQPPS